MVGIEYGFETRTFLDIYEIRHILFAQSYAIKKSKLKYLKNVLGSFIKIWYCRLDYREYNKAVTRVSANCCYESFKSE